ncbi:MAG: hypothetical protein ACYS21_16890 [Planctomycetota bacterium]|jgi:hypothetical protein
MCRRLNLFILVLAFCLTVGVASSQAVNINFQPPGAEVPPDYLADVSELFGDRGNGWSYGWLASFNETRDRNNHPDQRYDTLNHLQKDNQAQVWEIAIANGPYEVFMVCGDPSNTDQINNFDVEGVIVPDPDGEDNFDEYTIDVEVNDGRLTIQPAAGADNCKICFIDISLGMGASNPNPANGSSIDGLPYPPDYIYVVLTFDAGLQHPTRVSRRRSMLVFLYLLGSPITTLLFEARGTTGPSLRPIAMVFPGKGLSGAFTFGSKRPRAPTRLTVRDLCPSLRLLDGLPVL